LEQWGLINYQVDNEAKAAPLGPPCTSHFTILADTPSGLAPITSSRPTTGTLAAKQIADVNSLSTKKKEENEQKLNPLENVGLRSEYLKKQTATTTMNKNGMRTREWSDQEILLLLEGLEIFKDDWNKVCEHVSTRTQDECILKFLQLPIEDPYLDGTNSSALGPLSYQPIPFSQSGNPIMSTVAFLASVVDPRVASAAAKAAISEFSKMKDEVPPPLMENHLANVVQTVKDGKKLDSNYNIEQTGIAIVPSTESTAVTVVETTSENKDATKMEFESSSPSADKLPVVENPENETDSDSNTAAVAVVKVESTASITTTETVSQKDSSISESEIKSAAASALAAAAVKARHLANVEEKKIKTAVSQLVEAQLKKLELKLRHFEELEALMDRERESLEYQRQQLLQERQQFYLEQLKIAEFKQKEIAFQQLKVEGKLPPPPPPQQQQHPQQVQQIQVALPNVIIKPQNIVQNEQNEVINNEQVLNNVNMNNPQQTVIVMSMPQTTQPMPIQQMPIQQSQQPLQYQQQQQHQQQQQQVMLHQQQIPQMINNASETGKSPFEI
jgi:SWI/SNF related-matrix-associated actin-dependent regulator of chromatin subfamily C